MNKDLNLKQLNDSLKAALSKLKQSAVLIFIIGVLVAYSFLVLSINSLAQSEPSDEVVAEKMNTGKRLKIDQSSVDKLEELEDQNIAVQGLFEEARDNPFKD